MNYCAMSGALGTEVRLENPQATDEVLLIGCYHPSQQNTFTGRVTPAMLDAIFARARACAAPENRQAGYLALMSIM